MPKPNKEVCDSIKGVIALMEENPGHVNMDHWVGKESGCGTTACIAGYLNMYHGYSASLQEKLNHSNGSLNSFKLPKKATKVNNPFNIYTPGDIARSLLLSLDSGVTTGDLFFRTRWPEPFGSRYNKVLDAGYPELTREARIKLSKITIARLKHFMRTGE